MIKAPFNFVPLADNVYFPSWANDISQDIPFEDGVSGCIELKFMAQTPIFVRNGHTKHDAEIKNSTYSSFSNINNRYFIPATSIKGTIRTVLEIMSHGKMTQVEDSSFGKREVGKTPTAKEYLKMMRNVQCGWLKYDGNEAKLQDCGEPIRISIKEVDSELKTELYKFITTKDNFKQNRGRDAIIKYREAYDAWKKRNNSEEYRDKTFFDVPLKDYLKKSKGTIVLTGQPGKRYFDPERKNPKTKKDGMWCGKGKEFIFKDSQSEFETVPDRVMQSFLTIHKNTPDYVQLWRKKLGQGQEIPVFFMRNPDGSIHSMGLSYLYRYPFNRTVYDAIPKEAKNPEKSHKKDFKMDLAECMFGYTFHDETLKGRVHFGHALAIGNPTPMEVKEFVSSSPHNSYTPLYVEDGLNWDRARRIRGYKRYPIRKSCNYNNVGTDGMSQKVSMLKSANFKEFIRFFNLKPVELGALLSAITFHDNNDKCYHNIGFGKAYGYGKVKVIIEKLTITCGNGSNGIYDYMNAFEKSMVENDNNWLSSPQLTELMLMAKGIDSNQNSTFSYMKMSTNRENDEFAIAKNNRDVLKSFSELVDGEFIVNSIGGKKMETSVGAIVEQPKSVEIVPTTLEKGQRVKADCIEPKKVRIEGHDYDIQLVVSKLSNPNDYVGKTIDVVVAQISKAGKIVQVKLVDE